MPEMFFTFSTNQYKTLIGLVTIQCIYGTCFLSDDEQGTVLEPGGCVARKGGELKDPTDKQNRREHGTDATGLSQIKDYEKSEVEENNSGCLYMGQLHRGDRRSAGP